MFSAFEKKKYLLEEESSLENPFDVRIKQIETIRKNRLLQLEKDKQQAQKDLDESIKNLHTHRENTVQEALYYALLEPIIEQKFLFIDANVAGMTHWVDEVKLLRGQITQIYNSYLETVQDCNTKKTQFEHVKQECQNMLIQTEKLALLETVWNENGGIL
jgi:uncharacterized iron-regulated protein